MEIEEAFRSFGYTATRIPREREGPPVYYLTGRQLGHTRALLLEAGKNWTAGIVIGGEDDVPTGKRHDLLAKFMEINFTSMWAHISASRLSDAGISYFAETSMFSEEMNQHNLDEVIKALMSTAFRASQEFAKHGADLKSNPFREQLSRDASKP